VRVITGFRRLRLEIGSGVSDTIHLCPSPNQPSANQKVAMIKVSLVSSSERAIGVLESLSLIDDQVRITDTG